MKLFTEIMAVISEHPHTGSTCIMAEALASACSSRYKFSAIDVSVKLDNDNRALMARLLNVTNEPDYSNASQDAVLRRLREQNYI